MHFPIFNFKACSNGTGWYKISVFYHPFINQGGCNSKNIYWNQTAVLKVKDIITNEVPIQRRVRQGCVLSLKLFNLYSQVIFKQDLWNRSERIRIGGEVINTIRFVDDTAIMVETLEDLRH